MYEKQAISVTPLLNKIQQQTADNIGDTVYIFTGITIHVYVGPLYGVDKYLPVSLFIK